MPTVTATPFRAPRLDLAPLRAEDAEEMAAVLADPALHTFTGGAPDTPEALRARYRRQAARALVEWLGRHGVRTVTAHIHPAHHASAAVARAAGLTPTAEQQDGETRWRLALPAAG